MMPGDLNAYFGRMLENVEDVYRRDAAKIYQVMLRMTGEPYLVMFAFLWENSPNFGVQAKIEPASKADVERLGRILRAKINARCTDLLDIIRAPGAEAYFELKVAFLHRTVREYMERSDTKRTLAQWLSDDESKHFDPHEYIGHAVVAQIKHAPKKKPFHFSADMGPMARLYLQFQTNMPFCKSQGMGGDLRREFVRVMGEHGCDGLIKEEFRDL
jgi:hypothetical protein